MINRTLIETIRQFSSGSQRPLRSIFKRQNLRNPLLKNEAYTPLSLEEQWASLEKIKESVQKQSFNLLQQHQSTKEYLHALTYTLEKLREDLAPLLISTQQTSPKGYRRVKIQPQKSVPEKLRQKASEAA